MNTHIIIPIEILNDVMHNRRDALVVLTTAKQISLDEKDIEEKAYDKTIGANNKSTAEYYYKQALKDLLL